MFFLILTSFSAFFGLLRNGLEFFIRQAKLELKTPLRPSLHSRNLCASASLAVALLESKITTSKWLVLGVLVATTGYAADSVKVCNRTPQVRNRLEKSLSKKCEKITLKDLQSLQKLDLSNENISALKPGDFEELSSIQHLNLAFNKIEVVKNVFSGLSNLQILLLEGNQIKEIEPGAFSKLTNLEGLSLDMNQIKQIDAESYLGLRNLKRLDLSRNQISEIKSNNLKDMPALSNLNLEANKITIIRRNSFVELNELRGVELCENPLTRIDDGAFKGLLKLSYLPLEMEKRNLLKKSVFDSRLEKMPGGDCSSDLGGD